MTPRRHDRRVMAAGVMDGIVFVLRTGTPRRDLPARSGPWSTGFNRCNPGAGTAPGPGSCRTRGVHG